MRYVSLAITLYIFWLVLSGHFTPGLMAFGAGSVIATVALAARMRILDEEAHPVHLVGRAVSYLPWIVWEIVKAAWTVAKIVLDPKLPISPAIVRVTATQKTPTGINIYANSITLTPGTITMKVTGDQLVVHAVTQEGADDLAGGGMDARVTQFEGAK